MENFWIGSFPDWLVGIGTLALAVVTFVALRFDRAEKRALQIQLSKQAKTEQLRLERESQEAVSRREHELKQARRAQAQLVVAWADNVDVSDPNVYSEPSFIVRGRMKGAYVQNDSNLPVTNVQISWCYSGEDATGVFSTSIFETLPPRSIRGYVRPHDLIQQPTLPIEVVFTDAAGVLWRRTRTGQTEEVA